MKLLLVRHGETDLNAAGMFQGQSNIDLSAAGMAQAARLQQRLANEKIDFVYCSDLKRAVVTAQTITSGHRLEPVTCPELREIDYGRVEGLTFPEIQGRYPEVAELCITWSLKLRFPEGESITDLKRRLTRFFNKLKAHDAESTVLVVAHGGPLRFMVCGLLGIGLQHWRQINIDLASLSIVHIYPQVSILGLLNDTSHLR